MESVWFHRDFSTFSERMPAKDSTEKQIVPARRIIFEIRARRNERARKARTR
jgi:hypothetical protein